MDIYSHIDELFDVFNNTSNNAEISEDSSK
jgi:hypothetical protein